MKKIVIGIVAEFNPLHSGHSYLISQAKKYIEESESEGEIFCVMSEFFTQRGEVAIVDGYRRAEEAVKQGCDLVVALPYLSSVAYGDDFAKKSVSVLIDMGITHLIFGTENINLKLFEKIYNLQYSEEYYENYKELLKKGYNYANIMAKLIGLENNNPNFMLAYSYYKAIRDLKANIKLIPVKREGQLLNEDKVERKPYLSATAIRSNINSDKILPYLSSNMIDKIQKSNKINEEKLFNFIKYKILSLGVEGIKDIYDVNEGLENRIYQANLTSNSYKQLVDKIVTKRYSRKKIQRILLHILTMTTKEVYEKESQKDIFRVLAVKKEKTNIIREINSKKNILLISSLNKTYSEYFEHDIKVSRVYNMISGGKDIFKESIYLVE